MIFRVAAGLGILILVVGVSSLAWFNRSDNAAIAAGQGLYVDNCASCHGINGEGQPNWRIPDANGVYPAPPHTSDGHTWHHSDQLLLEIIANGGSSPRSAMPGFAEQLSEDEMLAILAYIKTFWGEEERRVQRQMTEQHRQFE